MVGSLHSPLLPLSSWIQKVLLRWIPVFFIICYKITIQPVSILCKNQNIIIRLITIHTSSLFVIFPRLLMKKKYKSNSWGTPNKSFFKCSYSNHILLIMHLPLTLSSLSFAFALRVRSLFKSESRTFQGLYLISYYMWSSVALQTFMFYPLKYDLNR